MTNEELAAYYFDVAMTPALVESGMPQDGIDHLRQRYVIDACANPRAVLELREWYLDLRRSQSG